MSRSQKRCVFCITIDWINTIFEKVDNENVKFLPIWRLVAITFFFFCNEIENKYHYYDLCQSQVFTGCGRSKLPHNDGFIWLTVLFRCFLFTFHSIYALNSMAETVEKAYFTSLCDDGDVRNFTEMTISHSTFALHCWPR